jgi:H+/Cl- antiporter ClcA
VVLLTTLITHLFGGSAGREGTAVQIGGSVASVLATWGKYTPEKAKILLICGISSGFGAVFGTPLAGAIFALEVVYSLGKRPLIQKAILPSLYTSVLADIICRGVGGYHTQYTMASYTTDLIMILKVVGAGCLFGGAGYLFIQATHWIKSKSHQYISKKGLIPMVGGTLVIGIATLLSGQEYLGLGVTTPNAGGVSIVSAFTAGGADLLSWAWKLLLTAITVGMGFKGGEVTPLFFIGATLGNTIATLTNAPIDLFAGLGFISVFAAATNTPIACTIMGMELFGISNTLYFAIACITAYRVSGRGTIYQK